MTVDSAGTQPISGKAAATRLRENQDTLSKWTTTPRQQSAGGVPQAKKRIAPTPADRAWKGFVRHCVCGLLVLGGITLWASLKHVPKSLREWQEHCGRDRYDVALVGNSMLGRGIDADQLSRRLGKRVVKLDSGGSASAWWYLVIKNLVARSANRPNQVLLFFRDHYLTDPGRRVLGKYAAKILAMSDANEPLIDDLVYRPKLGRVRHFLFKHWPAYRMREAFRKDLRGAVHGRVADLLRVEKKECRAAVDRVFAAENMVSELLTGRQQEMETVDDPGLYEFSEQLPRSLLPPIIAETKQCGIQLVLVRVKRRRDVVPGAEPERVRCYIAGLREYLSQQGVPLIDFTPCGSLQLADYADGDHLNEHGRDEFTRLLAETLSELPELSEGAFAQRKSGGHRR